MVDIIVDSAGDADHDASIRQKGFKILRFWNNDVLRNTEAVLEQIMDALAMQPGNPSPGSALRADPPSPRLRGEGKKVTKPTQVG
jgi:hypothetical protein